MTTNSFLRGLGLNEKEAEIYVYLAKNGPQKAPSVARSLRIHKMQVYRYLDAMQEKGVVSLTFTTPKRFVASSIDKLVKNRVRSLQEELLNIENNTDKILNYSGFSFPAQVQLSTFSIVQGREKVEGLVSALRSRVVKEMCVVTRWEDLSKFIMATSNDYSRKAKPEFSSRYIIQVNTKNSVISAAPLLRILNASGCRSHMIAADNKLPSLAIADDKEAVLVLEEPVNSVLWTDNPSIMCAMKGYFEKLWTDTIEMPPGLQEGRVITQ